MAQHGQEPYAVRLGVVTLPIVQHCEPGFLCGQPDAVFQGVGREETDDVNDFSVQVLTLEKMRYPFADPGRRAG